MWKQLAVLGLTHLDAAEDNLAGDVGSAANVVAAVDAVVALRLPLDELEAALDVLLAGGGGGRDEGSEEGEDGERGLHLD